MRRLEIIFNPNHNASPRFFDSFKYNVQYIIVKRTKLKGKTTSEIWSNFPRVDPA